MGSREEGQRGGASAQVSWGCRRAVPACMLMRAHAPPLGRSVRAFPRFQATILLGRTHNVHASSKLPCLFPSKGVSWPGVGRRGGV